MVTVGMFAKFINSKTSETITFWNTREKNINKRVPLVLTYHPSLEKISGIVHHHRSLIKMLA
jgi:hypothetical protein